MAKVFTGGRLFEEFKEFTLKNLTNPVMKRLSKSGELIKIRNVLLTHTGLDNVRFEVLEEELTPSDDDLAIFGPIDLVRRVKCHHSFHMLDESGFKHDNLKALSSQEIKLHQDREPRLSYKQHQGWIDLEKNFVADVVGRVISLENEFFFRMDKIIKRETVSPAFKKLLEGITKP